jgi:pimeloyl-ACP methyl ester carboxylesterase
MQWREERCAGRGARLRVRRVIDPPAPPVLLLHGLGVDGSVFVPFARRLLPSLGAVVPDLRGHGQSDAPASGYALPDYAGDLVELIEACLGSPGPVPVVGHSLGALVGMTLAALRPDLVSWLVLLDPPLDRDLRNKEVAVVFRLRTAEAGALEAYLLERNPGGGKLLAETLARLFRQASDEAFQVMLESGHFDAVPVAPPTLLVQADPARGGVLGDAAARDAVERLGHACLLSLPGAPHAVHASDPAAIARAILDLESNSRAANCSRQDND